MAAPVDDLVRRPRPSTGTGADRPAAVIEVTGLTKHFGHRHAVPALRGLDLAVRAGEVHGFLGPNGAGKTTTIRILLGLLRADAGVVRLLGGDPWRDATDLHRRLAYVPGEVSLWPQLTGGETIDLLGRLRGGLDRRRRAELLQRFDLDPTVRARAYSHGQRQKVALVAAFAAEADLLILDEPTSGLDPLMAEAFAECVREEQQRGRTVLLSSHILSEVEALCDRVTIIRNGRTVESGSVAEMKHVGRTFVDVTLRTPPPPPAALPGVTAADIDGRRVRCDVPTAQVGDLVGALAPYGIVTLTCEPPSLERLFLRHYGTGSDGPPTAGE